MFEKLISFFNKSKVIEKKQEMQKTHSKETAKERLQLVLMQDRAGMSADFLEMMKQEIIEIIKKYIHVDDKAIDVRLINNQNQDGTIGGPALFANIPITSIREEVIESKKETKIQVEEEKIGEDKKDKEEENQAQAETVRIEDEDKKETSGEANQKDEKEIEQEQKETEEQEEPTEKQEEIDTEEKQTEEEIKKEENEEEGASEG